MKSDTTDITTPSLLADLESLVVVTMSSASINPGKAAAGCCCSCCSSSCCCCSSGGGKSAQ